VLAYVFWHRPTEGADLETYEEALQAFHRSLARSRPAGVRGSATFRVGALPWFAGRAYEDWYLVEDYAALGVLNEAAVGRGHRTAHDRAAHHAARGVGGLYALCEGRPRPAALALSTRATWVTPARRADERVEMLADGVDPERSSLWRRQLVLAPAPEMCLLHAEEPPPGIGPERLPTGWRAQTIAREALWCDEDAGR
jgi:hypothetical protein